MEKVDWRTLVCKKFLVLRREVIDLLECILFRILAYSINGGLEDRRIKSDAVLRRLARHGYTPSYGAERNY